MKTIEEVIQELRDFKIEKEPDKVKCDHGVKFDEELAQNMLVPEIRKVFPRFNGTCPNCSYNGIAYASMAHYVYGDW
jgi:hypothetical protein